MFKDKTIPTVQDVETAKAVFIARAITVGNHMGYPRDTRTALSRIGLGDYFDDGKDAFDVSVDRLKELLGDVITARVPRGATPRSHSNYVRDDVVYPLLKDWSSSLTEQDWTQCDPEPQKVDIDETVKTYGSAGALPPVGGDEVTSVWRDLTVAVLQWADDRGLCSTVEDMLRQMGMGAFFPARRVDVTAQWRGQTFELTNVEADRAGKVRPTTLAAAVQRLVASDIPTVVKLSPTTPGE